MQVYRLFISRREEDALWRQRDSSWKTDLIWSRLNLRRVQSFFLSCEPSADCSHTWSQVVITQPVQEHKLSSLSHRQVWLVFSLDSTKVCPRDRLQRAQESFFHKHGNHPGHDFMQPTMRKKNKACKCKTLISNRSFSHQTWKCWRSQFRSSFSLTHRQPAVDAHFCHLHLNVDESQSQVHQFILFEYLIWIQI